MGSILSGVGIANLQRPTRTSKAGVANFTRSVAQLRAFRYQRQHDRVADGGSSPISIGEFVKTQPELYGTLLKRHRASGVWVSPRISPARWCSRFAGGRIHHRAVPPISTAATWRPDVQNPLRRARADQRRPACGPMRRALAAAASKRGVVSLLETVLGSRVHMRLVAGPGCPSTRLRHAGAMAALMLLVDAG